MSVTINPVVELTRWDGQKILIPIGGEIQELNLANGNFSTLWSALGLEMGDGMCGSIGARELSRAVMATPAHMICRMERVHEAPGAATVVSCGIHQEQANRYRLKLLAMCQWCMDLTPTPMVAWS